MGSSFIHLIRTDSNEFFLMDAGFKTDRRWVEVTQSLTLTRQQVGGQRPTRWVPMNAWLLPPKADSTTVTSGASPQKDWQLPPSLSHNKSQGTQQVTQQPSHLLTNQEVGIQDKQSDDGLSPGEGSKGCCGLNGRGQSSWAGIQLWHSFSAHMPGLWCWEAWLSGAWHETTWAWHASMAVSGGRPCCSSSRERDDLWSLLHKTWHCVKWTVMTWMVVTKDEGTTGVTRTGVTRPSGRGQGLILSSGCYECNLLLKNLPASCLSFLHSSSLRYPFINIPAITSAWCPWLCVRASSCYHVSSHVIPSETKTADRKVLPKLSQLLATLRSWPVLLILSPDP